MRQGGGGVDGWGWGWMDGGCGGERRGEGESFGH